MVEQASGLIDNSQQNDFNRPMEISAPHSEHDRRADGHA
jgi:hypothetical protein